MSKIHPQIKTRLGYEENIPDKEFLKDWKKRSTAVCKPCWELKYCPYGPFVEQSPLIPITRDLITEHIGHLKECLLSGQIGRARVIDDDEKELLQETLSVAKENPWILAPKVLRELDMAELAKLADEEGKDLLEYFEPPTSEFEKYKVPYPLHEKHVEKEIEIDDELDREIKKEIRRIEEVIATGIDDQRKPLDDARRRSFEKEIAEFKPEEYPDLIPQVVKDMVCNIFGHICPVVFVGESITETTEKRRSGRYIPYKIKIRIVRRDNYTCQKCGKHLKDDEVEFDHIIPVSKGGSTEEHNLKLSCFTCNRSKADKIEI